MGLTGEPEVAIKDVSYSAISIFAGFDLSQDGRTLVFHPQVDNRSQLRWFGRSGAALASFGPPGIYYEPRLSPDEKTVVYSRPDDDGGNRDLWLTDTSRGTTSRLTLTK